MNLHSAHYTSGNFPAKTLSLVFPYGQSLVTIHTLPKCSVLHTLPSTYLSSCWLHSTTRNYLVVSTTRIHSSRPSTCSPPMHWPDAACGNHHLCTTFS